MQDAPKNRQLSSLPNRAPAPVDAAGEKPKDPPKEMTPWEKDRYRAVQKGILCTARGCGGKMTRVAETRQAEGGIIRVRVCALCGTRGKTIEK